MESEVRDNKSSLFLPGKNSPYGLLARETLHPIYDNSHKDIGPHTAG